MIIQWNTSTNFSSPGYIDLQTVGTSLSSTGTIAPPAPSWAALGYIAMGNSAVTRGMRGDEYTYTLVRSTGQGMSIPSNPTM